MTALPPTAEFQSFVAGLAAAAAATLKHVDELLGSGEPQQETAPGAGDASEQAGRDASGAKPEDTARKVQTGLTSARQLIDTLGMLEQKTKGNLTTDEGELLQRLLTELRISYVRVADRAGVRGRTGGPHR